MLREATLNCMLPPDFTVSHRNKHETQQDTSVAKIQKFLLYFPLFVKRCGMVEYGLEVEVQIFLNSVLYQMNGVGQLYFLAAVSLGE